MCLKLTTAIRALRIAPIIRSPSNARLKTKYIIDCIFSAVIVFVHLNSSRVDLKRGFCVQQGQSPVDRRARILRARMGSAHCCIKALCLSKRAGGANVARIITKAIDKSVSCSVVDFVRRDIAYC